MGMRPDLSLICYKVDNVYMPYFRSTELEGGLNSNSELNRKYLRMFNCSWLKVLIWLCKI